MVCTAFISTVIKNFSYKKENIPILPFAILLQIGILNNLFNILICVYHT